jgi:hypothetical protein
MARFWSKSWDWCHVCGTRQGHNVEISYPSNAEHQYVGADGKCSPGDKGKFLRICADCGETIARIGRGEIKQAVRNNPALIPALVRGISPYTNPDDN